LDFNSYSENIKLKDIANNVNKLLDNININLNDNIQTIINIIVNLQQNLRTINLYSINNFNQNIKNKYIKYIQYLQKIIIVKLWKDMKILELFLLMFKEDGIVNTLINNLDKFKQKVETVEENYNTLDKNNFNNETNKELIGGVKEAYNNCLKNIREILDKFVQTGGGQQGGEITVGIINTTNENNIKDHILFLKQQKKKFEEALETNITAFNDLCEIFKNILNKILDSITTYTNTKVVKKYINIGGLEESLYNLNDKNKILMDTLKNFSESKKNDLSGGTRKKKSKPKSKSKSKK